MTDYDAEIVSLQTSDGRMGMSTTEFHKEILEEQADELGISLSAACRYWIAAGMKLHNELDPRDGRISEPDYPTEDPLGQLIEDEIPSGKENAEEMSEVIDKIQDQVETEFLDYVEESDEIEREKWEVYK